MSSDDDLQNAVLAIHARLGTIEGKLNLLARAERNEILRALEQAFVADPLLSQIYLLLDGRRSQKEVHESLMADGIKPSQPTVSRRMDVLVVEYGVADEVRRGVLRKNKAAEDVLSLSRKCRRWLEQAGATVPSGGSKK